MNESDRHKPLFGQISLWQLVVLITVFAALFSITCAVGMHSAYIYGFLLLPTLAFVVLQLVGYLFRPATTIGNQPGIYLSACVMSLLLGLSLIDLAWIAVFLPLAAIWMAQVAALQIWVSRIAPEEGTATPSSRLPLAELFLVGCLLLITLGMAGLYGFSLGNHVTGSGTLFDSYWLISTAQHHTLYDCQTGYDGHPWRFNMGAGGSVSGRSNPDWSFLGLERYRVGKNRGATHIPHWMPLGLAITYPALWIFAKAREIS
ncbi:MAG: hypothetical protein AAF497_00935 [Planctomycetota bacterium]